MVCVRNGSENPGIYVGETSRTLAERSSEHIAMLKNVDPKSFMVKHWALAHAGMDSQPSFKFEVVRKHKDSLSRMLHEALLIEKEANMNSKSEFRSNRLTRLVIEAAPWEEKRIAREKRRAEKDEHARIAELKLRVEERTSAEARHAMTGSEPGPVCVCKTDSE